ncbi:MAG: 4Fe-4S binding protein [Candidatus Helarchaeota archaeon]
MLEINRHPNIELMTYTEIKEISGFIGNFKLNVVKKPRYVDGEICNGCGACWEACPIDFPNSFNFGFSPRKAIDIPFAQAVPTVPNINMDYCVRCFACVNSCEVNALDFSQEPEELELEVGTIIVATGWDMYESVTGRYGYGKYENVINQIQLERLLSANGPTEGHLVRVSDNEHPKKILMINCVGARSSIEGEHPFCSGVCCLVTIKNAKLVKSEYPDAEVIVSYRDIRTPGKDYEEYYQRARTEGITFIKGNVGDIEEDPITKNLICYLEDEGTGTQLEYEADMVVLSATPYPSKGTAEIAEQLKLEKSVDGYIKEFHARLNPIDSKIPGIYLSGFAQGPKAVDATVNQAKGAASSAGILMKAGKYEIELIRAISDPAKCTLCGLCVEICPYQAISIKNDKIVVDDILCRGCGACSAICKNNAMTLRYFRNETFEGVIDGIFQMIE